MEEADRGFKQKPMVPDLVEELVLDFDQHMVAACCLSSASRRYRRWYAREFLLGSTPKAS
jgi:hypothetical protein